MNRIDLTGKISRHPQILDARGARPKFWFTFLDQSISSKQEEWLFKNTNKALYVDNTTQTFEDVGEVIFSKICRKLGIDCVDYKLAQYQDNDGLRYGVICKDYNPEQFSEFSGHAILEIYTNFMHDNFKGFSHSNENTLFNYKRSFNCIMLQHDKEKTDIRVNVTNVFRLLSKMMILDYICCQSDRNFYNISFLLDRNTQELKMVPLFDNGNIFSWNFRESVINHQNIVLSKEPTIERFKELYQSKSLALGVKTPVSYREHENPTKANSLKYKDLPANIVEDELSDLIIEDKELQEFLKQCEHIPQYIDEAFTEFQEEYGENYNLLRNQSSLISKIKQQYLLTLVKEKIQKMEREDENNV